MCITYGGQTQQYGEPVLHTVHYKYSQILSKENGFTAKKAEYRIKSSPSRFFKKGGITVNIKCNTQCFRVLRAICDSIKHDKHSTLQVFTNIK